MAYDCEICPLYSVMKQFVEVHLFDALQLSISVSEILVLLSQRHSKPAKRHQRGESLDSEKQITTCDLTLRLQTTRTYSRLHQANHAY
jgi:hypothetical protein